MEEQDRNDEWGRKISLFKAGVGGFDRGEPLCTQVRKLELNGTSS